jgi:hypothetical protein
VWGGMELHILIVVPIPLAIHSILCSLTSGAIDDLWASGIHNQDNDDQSSEPFNCSPPPADSTRNLPVVRGSRDSSFLVI